LCPIVAVAALAAVAAVGQGAFAPEASASTITVQATSDIFLAGQSSIPTNFPYNNSVQNYPASGYGAGTLPPMFAVTAGEILTISATGNVSCCFGGSPTNGPDGGGLGGLADITGYGNVGAYINSVQFPLVGVFNVGTTPWTILVIGSKDTLTVPVGATELYLGLPDALGFQNPPGYYNDNSGAFTVDITATPLPSTWTILIVGFLGLGFVAYFGSKKSVAVAAA
jgi:hypothetical protein